MNTISKQLIAACLMMIGSGASAQTTTVRAYHCVVPLKATMHLKITLEGDFQTPVPPSDDRVLAQKGATIYTQDDAGVILNSYYLVSGLYPSLTGEQSIKWVFMMQDVASGARVYSSSLMINSDLTGRLKLRGLAGRGNLDLPIACRID